MGVNMSYYEIIDAFTYYGADVVALSIVTSAITQLLKVTILKKADKKFITFVPFIVGTVVYAIYYMLVNLSFACIVTDLSLILEKGVTCGTLATVVYIIYEQFGKGGGSGGTGVEKLIESLIEAYVRSDCKSVAGEEIVNALSSSADNSGVFSILSSYRADNVTDGELENLSCIVVSAYKSYVK
jgi:hypothetical protein